MPDDFTGSRFFDFLLWLTSVATAVGMLGGGVWWLILPRFREWASELIHEVGGVREQLADDKPDSVGRHAKVAAQGAAELPQIKADVSQLADDVANFAAWRVDIDRRLGGVEQVMVALAGPELRRRLFEDLQHDIDERRNHEDRS